MNLCMEQKQTQDVENRFVVAKGEWGSGGRMDWVFGISRCKLLHTGWINNKVLLYSTGNYIQYPVINHNEKGRKEGRKEGRKGKKERKKEKKEKGRKGERKREKDREINGTYKY